MPLGDSLDLGVADKDSIGFRTGASVGTGVETVGGEGEGERRKREKLTRMYRQGIQKQT
jgi:hypothetical protein